jgi:hypothetical protein
MISDDRKEAIQKYCIFMDEIKNEKEEFEDVDIVGEEAYKKMMKTTEVALQYYYSMEKMGENIGISHASVREIVQKIKAKSL